MSLSITNAHMKTKRALSTIKRLARDPNYDVPGGISNADLAKLALGDLETAAAELRLFLAITATPETKS